jgi:biopolymer transport protein ExbD
MAEIAESGGGGHGKGGKKRAKKSSTRVDMTPMVDLAFLLLTFFVLTSTFSKPKVMSLVYPAKPDPLKKEEPKPISNGVTFLLSKDKIFYYQGQYYPVGNPQGKPPTELKETNFGPEGVRKLLADMNTFVLKGKEPLELKVKNKQLADSTYLRMVRDLKKSPDALKVLIKTDDQATCRNFVDLIDELKVNDIGVIAPVDILASELELLKTKTGK